MKKLKLNSSTEIPILGFGTWQLQGNEAYQSVSKALEIGYRYIDTADRYDNHRIIAKAVNDSGINREDLFLLSKIWMTELKKEEVIDAGKRFLDELQTDYLDLLLIHWPNRQIPIQETLEGFAYLKEKNLIKAIGVSNFTIHHLEDVLETGIEVSANQVEFHPSLNQGDLKSFCDKKNIKIIAYSPLAQGKDLSLPSIQELAKKYDKSTAQVILNWLNGKDIIAIPRSSNPDHIEDNFKTTEWKLSSEDIERIDRLNKNNRILNPSFGDFDY